MDIARLALEYLRVLLSWPIIFGALGLYFLNTFHDPIADVLRRFVRATGYGVSVEASPSVQLQEIRQTNVAKPAEDQLHRYIRDNPGQVVNDFLRTFNAYWFERSFNLIFGTQIALLEFLLEKRTDGEAYINLEHFYQEFTKRVSSPVVQFADYVGFLLSANFVRYEGSPIRVYITDYGVDFLSYIRTQYAPTYRLKPF